PSVTPSIVQFGLVINGETGDLSEFRRYSLRSGRLLSAPAPHALVSTSYDLVNDATFFLQSEVPKEASSGDEMSGCGARPSPTLKCTVGRADEIGFEPIRR